MSKISQRIGVKKIADMGEGGLKNPGEKKQLTSLMEGPFANRLMDTPKCIVTSSEIAYLRGKN
jgi:hypothetical protein